MNETDFDQLVGGVNEVIAVPDEPAVYTAEEVRKVRKTLQLSQGLFVKVLNVSVNTVRKYEIGYYYRSKNKLSELLVAVRAGEGLTIIALPVGKPTDPGLAFQESP